VKHSPATVLTILEQAMGFPGQATSGGVAVPSGRPFIPGASVKFPDKQVIAADRVGMWIDGENIRLGMWPAELQPQYNRVYSDPQKVDALIVLGGQAGWALSSNFHLAYRFAGPQQRWYPGRHLPGPDYVRQWIRDLRAGHARGRVHDELQDPNFRQWLVDRNYAHADELPTLDGWLANLSPGIRFHVRPSIEIAKDWSAHEALAADRHGEFVAAVRATIDQVLSALDEPRLTDLESPSGGDDMTGVSGAARKPRILAHGPVAMHQTACPACHLVHAGECDW
jgi:hypothetical protein